MKATKTEIAMEIITGAGKAVLESRVTRGIAIVHSYFDLGKDTVKRINNNELKDTVNGWNVGQINMQELISNIKTWKRCSN